MTKYFEKLHKKIVEIIEKSPVEEDSSHSDQVWKFVLEIEPNASEELQIAALCHDIERGVAPRTEQKEDESYSDYKQRHAKRSADITVHLMEGFKYPQEMKLRARKLIENHEVGGDLGTDILRDADSVSYFANNINSYLKRNGVNRTKDKIRLMYYRVSEQTKNIIKSLKYNDDTQKLIDDLIY